MSFRSKFIGNKHFYRTVLGIALPIMVQNGISTFVSMLDNLMVGRLGTESMAGVSIVNQFTFIFSLVVFGAVSAAGIFMAQFHGKGDRGATRRANARNTTFTPIRYGTARLAERNAATAETALAFSS